MVSEFSSVWSSLHNSISFYKEHSSQPGIAFKMCKVADESYLILPILSIKPMDMFFFCGFEPNKLFRSCLVFGKILGKANQLTKDLSTELLRKRNMHSR